MQSYIAPESWISKVNCKTFSYTPPPFEELWNLKPENRQTIKLFGKTHEVPRWHQVYEKNYKFRGMNTEQPPETPEVFSDLLKLFQERVSPKLNGILVNWYNPEDYIAMHSDSEKELDQSVPIVTVTFIDSPSESRKFVMKSVSTGESQTWNLFNEDVFIMGGKSQETHKHGLPRSKKYKHRRISVTFRSFF